MLCKCCGKEARWCAEGWGDVEPHVCDDIHCEHCGMHYSLQSRAAIDAETVEEARELMLAVYEGRVIH